VLLQILQYSAAGATGAAKASKYMKCVFTSKLRFNFMAACEFEAAIRRKACE